MGGEIHAERDGIISSIVLAGLVFVIISYLTWILVRDPIYPEHPLMAVPNTAHGRHLSPVDSIRVDESRERALEIAGTGRWEVLDVTWILFSPRSSLYILLQKQGREDVQSRIVFHLVSGESPRFADRAKLREQDVVGLVFVDQPGETVYLGPFAGPQDYMVPRSASR